MFKLNEGDMLGTTNKVLFEILQKLNSIEELLSFKSKEKIVKQITKTPKE